MAAGTANGAEDLPTEIELKLTLANGDRRRVERHPAISVPSTTKPKSRHEVTTYFDTQDGALAKHGVSLRVRRARNRRIQTVKQTGRAADVVAQRGEWEWEVAQDSPDLAPLARTPLATVVEGLQDKLVPAFTTDIRRSSRTIRVGDTTAEVVFDEGTIETGSESTPVHEMELELRDGSVAPLYRLALELQNAVPLLLAVESKAMRGERLRSGCPPTPVHAADLTVERSDTVLEAVHAVLHARLGELVANQPAAAAGVVEGIHQMRVAIRRMRTALKLFGPCLDDTVADRFAAELQRLGRVLGHARDWDVFVTETLPRSLDGAPGDDWHPPLEAAAEEERMQAHRAVRSEFSSPAFTSLVLGLAAWLEDGLAQPALMGNAKLRRPLAKMAPALLDRLADNVSRRGRRIGRRSAEELHALRRAMKKLRYSVEDLSGVFKRKEVKDYIGSCKKLQKQLGHLNDAAVAQRLASQLSAGERPGLAPGIGVVTQWTEQRHDKAIRRLRPAWKKFSHADQAWL